MHNNTLNYKELKAEFEKKRKELRISDRKVRSQRTK